MGAKQDLDGFDAFLNSLKIRAEGVVTNPPAMPVSDVGCAAQGVVSNPDEGAPS